MAKVVSQYVRHLGCHLGFFKNFIFSKTAAMFLEIRTKGVFTALNRNIVKNRVEKTKLEQILSKNTVLLFKFYLHSSFCIKYKSST